MPTNLDKLRSKLAELFQLDQADLDFGIYRIMNSKREEILRFLDKDLLPQVQSALAKYKDSGTATLSAELAALEARLKADGVEPGQSKKYQELAAKLDDAKKSGLTDAASLEQEVFSDLFNFFSRYYDEGDFLSLRRYKAGVYAVPYEGEEVYLHWANKDQYYIKTSEYLRDYAFKLSDGRRVHFKLVEATTETDNKKEQAGQERRFILDADEPIAEEAGAEGKTELFIRFHYKPVTGEKKKQAELNAKAVAAIFASKKFSDWTSALSKLDPSSSNPDRTLLEKHLNGYTARNTFDYFIHKDLGGFLRRELDFFIKNEVMHLDDIESDTAPRVEQYLSKIRVFRAIAGKIILFLEQLETFQKRLWLKKKFVVETNYCLTLDRIPEALYSQIAENAAQQTQWQAFYSVQEAKGYTSRPSLAFLRSHKFLPVDTSLFDSVFRDQIVEHLDNLDGATDGYLLWSENFQGLNFVSARLRAQVKVVYIDPPYNTDVSAIPYKNNYRHSSFATMIHDRVDMLYRLLPSRGVLFVSIDKTERSMVEYALDNTFGHENKVEELIWVQNTNDGRSPTYSTNHEYVEVYAKDKPAVEADFRMFREPKPGYVEVAEIVNRLNPLFPTISEIEAELVALYRQHRREYRKFVERQGLLWEIEKRNDPWKGIYQYKFAEYRDAQRRWVDPVEAKRRDATIWVYRESDWTIMSSEAKQSKTTRDPKHPNYRFYQPVHPTTKRPCAMPSRGWKGTQSIDSKHPDRKSFESLVQDHRIAFGPDESKVPQQKRMLNEVATNVSKSVIVDYADGEKETTALFGKAGVFLAPKHTSFVRRFVRQTADPTSMVLDCFGGSGSTAHAVIQSNREEGTKLKYLLIEVNDYFDKVLKPRVLKAVHAGSWKAGKPTSEDGLSHCVKVLRLESYEDCLQNIATRRSASQDGFLAASSGVREDYTLRYMLDVETRESLLKVEQFSDPYAYTLKVHRSGETQEVAVDLVETFNWLLGLTVKSITAVRNIRVVEGTNPEGQRVLVLWRKTVGKDAVDNDALNKWFEKSQYSTKDREFDLIYVNGDNHLENVRGNPEHAEATWKVRLIESEFQRLMFEDCE